MSQSLTQTFTIQREVQLRFLLPSDIAEIKSLCTEWFPIEYPNSWYEDITSNRNFHSLAATYGSKIIGILVCEVQPFSKCNREVSQSFTFPHLLYKVPLLGYGYARYKECENNKSGLYS
jgi:hypothetical protein